MTRTLVLVLAALVLAGCAGLPDIPPGEYDVYPVGRTLEPGQTGCFFYGSPNGQYAACVHQNPLPTQTPPPSPTQETSPIPTITPTPSITPTPAPACYAVNNLAVGIRIRADHNASAAQVGSLAVGERAVVSQVYRAANGERWARIPAGWVATWYGGATIATLTGDCEGVPMARNVRGLHVLSGSLAPEYAAQSGVLKCLDLTPQVCLAAKQANPGLTIIYRTFQYDSPSFEWYSPGVWYARISERWPPGYDFYEIVNEVAPPNNDYAAMAAFFIEVATYAGRNGQTILAGSFATGNPDLDAWADLVAYLRWAEAHPVNGRYHGLALHQSAYLPAPYTLKIGQWLNGLWTAGRDTLVAQTLRGFGFDLAKSNVPLYITESGLSDGYSGSWNDRWSCEEVAAAFKETARRYEARGYIDGLTWWNVGKAGQWTDDGPCLPMMYG